MKMTTTGHPQTVKSAMRTLDIIELVVARSDGIVAQEISKALAIPISSLSYLLATLVERGYLHRVGRLYFRGDGLDRLSNPQYKRTLAEMARPLVRTLRLKTGETASYFVRDGWQLVAAITESAEHQLRYSIAVGSRVPLHCVAAGKSILAAMDETELARYFAETELTAFTSTTITTESELRQEIDNIRKTGIGLTNCEHIGGIRGVGIATSVDGVPVGGFGLAIPESRYNDEVEARTSSALNGILIVLAASHFEPKAVSGH
jgi:IclR family acetate operon transcriptional repressor